MALSHSAARPAGGSVELALEAFLWGKCGRKATRFAGQLCEDLQAALISGLVQAGEKPIPTLWARP